MKPYASRLTVIAAVMLAVLAVVPAMYAHADKANPSVLRDARLLNITLGKGDVIDVPGDIADVLLANPAIADVVALQSRKLYIVGSQLGNTNMTLLDQTGSVMAQYDIHVKIDERAIQDYINHLYPDEKVRVKALNGQIILTGTVSNPGNASKISQVVAAYMGEAVGRRGTVDDLIVNLLQVTGEQQVMLKVKVFEASKTLLRELGLETQLDTVGTGFGGNLDAAMASTGANKLTRTPMALGALVFNDGNFGPLSLLARALEDQNLAHVLAEPNLTAISGEEAGFLAGGEFPVPTGRDNEGNVTVQFRSFGVSLNFRPVVMSENRISLQLNTEVSSLARDQGVTIAGLDIPGLSVRRASTTVEVPSGGGLMIAGLLESQAVKGMAGLPGIKDVPVLGDLVSSRSFSRDESELIVLITAYLVKPYAEQMAEMKRAEVDMNAAYRPPVMPPIAARPVPVVEETQPVAMRALDAPAVAAPAQVLAPPSSAPAAVAPAEGAALTRSFANNIRRIYGRKAPAILDDDQNRFGYLVQ